MKRRVERGGGRSPELSGTVRRNAVEDMARSGIGAKSRSAGEAQGGGACPDLDT